MFAQQIGSAKLLLFSLIVGAALGCFYDILRVAVELIFPIHQNDSKIKNRLSGNEKQAVRAMYGTNVKINGAFVLTIMTDIVFFAVSAVSVIVLLFHLNYGRVRLFSLVSAITGYTVYRFTIGRAIAFLLKKTLAYLAKALKKVILILFYPIALLCRRICAPIVARINKRMKRRKAQKILALMEKNEMSRRKKRNDKK